MSFKFSLIDNFPFFTNSPKPDSDTNIMSINIDTYNSETTFKLHNTITKICKIGYLNGSISNKLKDYGSYIIIVNSQIDERPNVIFCISRSNKLSRGNITKLTETLGTDDDFLELEWNPGEYPLLKYNYKIPYNASQTSKKIVKLTFFVKIISTF